MPLTKAERIQIIKLWGGRSSRAVAHDFNERNPQCNPVSHVAVSQLLTRFEESGTVQDRPRSGRPRTATDEGTATAVLASFAKSPQRSTRRMSLECGVSQSSICRMLKMVKWHPYKLQLQHHLSEDDPDRRMQFCEWAVEQLQQDPHFALRILHLDEANFYVNGEVNKQNMRYWSSENPLWRDPSKMVGAGKVMVWAGIWGTRIIGPFFIHANLNAEGYLQLLQDHIFPSLLTEDGSFPSYFQQDGAPPHYGRQVRQYLDLQFPGRWIGRRGPVEWPARSPDLTPLDFYLWGHVKSNVYAEKIRDVGHLEQRILDACAQITPQILLRVHRVWEHRLNMCIAHNGQHIEHIV